MKRLSHPLALLAFVFVPMLALTPGVAHAALKSPYLDSLQKNFYVPHCCASKLGECAQKKPACKIAPRLTDFITWMDSIGKNSDDKMLEALNVRYQSLTDKKAYPAVVKGWPTIGDASSPVTVVMYLSATCPTCKSNFKDLHKEVTVGSLKGKAKIVAKPFGTSSANKALIVAYDFGRFSDFMLALAEVNVRVDEEVIYAVADRLYFNRDKFKSLVESKEIEARANQALAEANKNGIQLVPTYLISGRKYDSVTNARWVSDAIEYILGGGQ